MAGKRRSLRKRSRVDRPQRERKPFRSSLLRRCAKSFILTMLALLGLGSAVGLSLHHKAEQKAERLQDALTAGDWEKVSTLRQESDIFPYRLFSPRLKKLLPQAARWEQQQGRALDILQRRTEEARLGRRSIDSLSPKELAETERALSILHPSLRKVGEEWKELCRKEHARLEARKQEEIRRLEEALPPEATLREEPTEDVPLLRRYQSQLATLEERWLNARDAYHLPESAMLPIRERLRRAHSLMEEAEAMQLLVAELPAIRDYGAYRTRLKQITASTYPPALRGSDLSRHLPEEEEILRRVQAERLGLSTEKLDAFQKTHVQGEATFSPTCPATQEQVQLMERIFAARALQRELTEWVNNRGDRCLTEEEPRREEGNNLRLTRSELDPEYSVSRAPSLLWEAAGSRRLRIIQTAAFLKSCHLQRETFFRKLNLMTALGSVLHYEREDCPARTRAWVYDTLLRVMQAHPQPILMGLPYSPSLRRDQDSFRRLREQCRIKLESGCWLVDTPQTRHAEAAFQEWFRNRKHRDYAGEASRRVADLLREHLLYVGYVDLRGKPVFCRKVPPHASLWYFSEQKLVSVPATRPLQHPSPLSPLLLCESSSSS